MAGDRTWEATILLLIGEVYKDLGEKQKALDYFNQALLLYQAVGDKAMEAITVLGIGKMYSELAENHKALDYYNQALPLYQS